MSVATPTDTKIFAIHCSIQWALDRNLKCITEADPKKYFLNRN